MLLLAQATSLTGGDCEIEEEGDLSNRSNRNRRIRIRIRFCVLFFSSTSDTLCPQAQLVYYSTMIMHSHNNILVV